MVKLAGRIAQMVKATAKTTSCKSLSRTPRKHPFVFDYKQQSCLPNPPAGPPQIWDKDWEMELNPSKCLVQHITRARTPIRHQFVLHGQVLEAVEHAKYLGLEISNGLNWNTHIQNLTTKANRTLGFVRRNIPTKHQGIQNTSTAPA